MGVRLIAATIVVMVVMVSPQVRRLARQQMRRLVQESTGPDHSDGGEVGAQRHS